MANFGFLSSKVRLVNSDVRLSKYILNLVKIVMQSCKLRETKWRKAVSFKIYESLPSYTIGNSLIKNLVLLLNQVFLWKNHGFWLSLTMYCSPRTNFTDYVFKLEQYNFHISFLLFKPVVIVYLCIVKIKLHFVILSSRCLISPGKIVKFNIIISHNIMKTNRDKKIKLYFFKKSMKNALHKALVNFNNMWPVCVL